MNCTANIAKGLRRDYKGAAMSLCPGWLPEAAPAPCRAMHAAAPAAVRFDFVQLLCPAG